jgi:DNA polymerase-3 subunit alpha
VERALHSSSESFVHLHVHSEYSLLDGAAKIKAICKKAAEQGAPAVALTDHGVMYGALEFYAAAKDHGLTPIIGVEAYMAPNGRLDKTVRNEAHVTLLAQDEDGYRNLIRLVSLGFTEGFYYKPRIDIDLLAAHSKGIICLSGCLSGLVQAPLQRGDYAAAKAAAQAYKDIFGDRFYLELMRHGIADQAKVERDMLRLHRELGVPLVATNDSHYVEHADHGFHDVLLCVGTAAVVSAEKRFRLEGEEFYLKTADQMRTTFADIPEACDATLEIARRVNLELSVTNNKTFHIPQFPIPERHRIDRDDKKPMTPEKYLRKLCEAGLKKRYGTERVHSDPALLERMDYELGVINKMGFASYFLIVWDFIKFARDNGIPVGPGRGSAVGSIVSYCLGITALDPIRFGLIFERFLNPDRISMPDIDTDFCINGRERVIQYVTEKYGADRVAGIVTFLTLAARSAVHDAGRALEVPLATVAQITKMIPSGPKGMSVAQARVEIPELAAFERRDPSVRRLMETAQEIEGFVRNTGTHAAAVVIADAPLTDYLPLVTIKQADGEGSTVNTQFEMDWIEKIGLLKMDFLGLRNLTLMRSAEMEICRSIDPAFRLADIPDDDAKTFAMLSRGETSGVFQLESDGMRAMLMRMRPDRLEDVIAAVALYRPGPMEWIPQYISNKHGRTKPTYLHEKLEPILAPTYAVAAYQEQVMQIARDIAGYSMAAADELRKVMGKKIVEKIAAQRVKFVDGAVANGVDRATAENIFRFIEPFAGYGFNKSHAVAYGWISYQTAYLKANFPLQYLAAVMSATDGKEKLVEYIEEARRSGITVAPPDVNLSQVEFAVADGAIRFGFKAIKGITESSVQGIIAERDANGPFTSIFDLVARVAPRGVQSSTIEALVKTGACDTLPGHRAQQIAALDNAFGRAKLDSQEKDLGQMSFLSAMAGTMPEPRLPKEPPVTKAAQLLWEAEGLGIYVSGHPVDCAQPLLNRRGTKTVSAAKQAAENQVVLVGGMVGPIRRIVTKAGGQMLITSIEDRTGSIVAVLFPRQYEAHQASFVEGSIVAISGTVKIKKKDDDDEGVSERNLIVSAVDEIAPLGYEPVDLAKKSAS